MSHQELSVHQRGTMSHQDLSTHQWATMSHQELSTHQLGTMTCRTTMTPRHVTPTGHHDTPGADYALDGRCPSQVAACRSPFLSHPHRPLDAAVLTQLAHVCRCRFQKRLTESCPSLVTTITRFSGSSHTKTSISCNRCRWRQPCCNDDDDTDTKKGQDWGRINKQGS